MLEYGDSCRIDYDNINTVVYQKSIKYLFNIFIPKNQKTTLFSLYLFISAHPNRRAKLFSGEWEFDINCMHRKNDRRKMYSQHIIHIHRPIHNNHTNNIMYAPFLSTVSSFSMCGRIHSMNSNILDVLLQKCTISYII